MYPLHRGAGHLAGPVAGAFFKSIASPTRSDMRQLHPQPSPRSARRGWGTNGCLSVRRLVLEHDGCPDRASDVAAVMVRRRGSPLNSQKTPPRAISHRKFETTLQPRGMTVLPAQVCPRSLAKRASLDVAARARSRMWQKVASKLCRLVTRPRRGRCHLEPVWMSPCAVLCGGSVSSLEGRGGALTPGDASATSRTIVSSRHLSWSGAGSW